MMSLCIKDGALFLGRLRGVPFVVGHPALASDRAIPLTWPPNGVLPVSQIPTPPPLAVIPPPPPNR